MESEEKEEKEEKEEEKEEGGDVESAKFTGAQANSAGASRPNAARSARKVRWRNS